MGGEGEAVAEAQGQPGTKDSDLSGTPEGQRQPARGGVGRGNARGCTRLNLTDGLAVSGKDKSRKMNIQGLEVLLQGTKFFELFLS